MSEQTISQLAEQAYGYFETRHRDDGEPYDSLRDGSPDWVRHLVFQGHDSGEWLPDDWRYSSIRSALEAIADSNAEDADDLDDIGTEFADANVDTYTGSLFDWVQSHAGRLSYCDEAQAEGLASDGAGIDELLRLGQYMESGEIFGEMRDGLAERLEEVTAAV